MIFDQFRAVVVVGLRSLKHQKEEIAITALSMACIVGVFIGLLAISEGFSRFVAITNERNIVLVMREGADSEVNSPMSYDTEVPYISNSKYVKRLESGDPIASPEFLWSCYLKNTKSGKDENIGFRGVTGLASKVRQNFKIVQGRNFKAGLNEVIVGQGLLDKYEGAALGRKAQIMGLEWTIVGVFSDGGSPAESEIWLDLPVLQGVLPWEKEVQSVRVLLKDPEQMSLYKDELLANKQVKSRPEFESEYLQKISKQITDKVTNFVYPIVLLMSLGGLIGIIITAYNSIDDKKVQIATLKILGFRNSPILLSLIVETIILGMIGAAIGVLIVYLIFNGYSASTTSGDMTAVQFHLLVTPTVIWKALLLAVLLSSLASVFPAIYAVRLPLNKSL